MKPWMMIVSAVLCSSWLAWAAEPAVFPGGAVLSPVPDFASWQVNFTYAADSNKAAVSTTSPVAGILYPVRTLTVTKTKAYSHIVMVDVLGQVREVWHDGRFGMGVNPGEHPHFTDGAAPTTVLPNCGGTEFAELSWLAEKYFTGLETVAGKKCLVFRRESNSVWIDRETRLPVKATGAEGAREYVFLPAPTEMLELPKEFAEMSEHMKKVQRNHSRMAPKGG